MAEEPKNRRRPSRTPWLTIARAVPLSFDVRKIVLGTVALILIQAGWAALDRPAPAPTSAASMFLDLDGRSGYPPILRGAVGPSLVAALARIAEPVRVLVGPLLQIVSFDGSLAGSGRAGLALLWAVVVMTLVGGAVARSAVREIAMGDRGTLVENLRFALRSWRPLLGTPLCPLAGAAVCFVGCALIGGVYRLPIVGGPVAGFTFFVPLALGLVIAVLLIDLVAAWPFFPVVVAADSETSLDALSRAFGYVNRRPVPFVACVAGACVLGVLGLVAVDFLAMTTLRMTAWGLGLTAPRDVLGLAAPPALDLASRESPLLTAAAFWSRAVILLSHGWVFSYFWSAATATYLVLRQDVDGVPPGRIKDDSTATS